MLHYLKGLKEVKYAAWPGAVFSTIVSCSRNIYKRESFHPFWKYVDKQQRLHFLIIMDLNVFWGKEPWRFGRLCWCRDILFSVGLHSNYCQCLDQLKLVFLNKGNQSITPTDTRERITSSSHKWITSQTSKGLWIPRTARCPTIIRYVIRPIGYCKIFLFAHLLCGFWLFFRAHHVKQVCHNWYRAILSA